MCFIVWSDNLKFVLFDLKLVNFYVNLNGCNYIGVRMNSNFIRICMEKAKSFAF